MSSIIFEKTVEYIENVLNDEGLVEDKLCMDMIRENIDYPTKYLKFLPRIFSRVMGISIRKYITKRKLSLAANALLNTTEQIINIALRYGFSDQSNFTARFKKHFDMTPVQYRNAKIAREDLMTKPFTVSDIQKKIKENAMELKGKYEEKEKMTLVGLEFIVNEKTANWTKMWKEFEDRFTEIKHKKDDKSYAVNSYPEDEKFVADTMFNVFLCVEVSDTTDIPEGMVSRVIEQQDYAIYKHEGDVETLDKTYKQIYAQWSNSKKDGYELADDFDIEVYDKRYNPDKPEESYVRIFVPVAKVA